AMGDKELGEGVRGLFCFHSLIVIISIPICFFPPVPLNPDRRVIRIRERQPVPIALVLHEKIQAAIWQDRHAAEASQMVTARTGIEVVVRRSRVRRGPASGEGVEPPQRIRQGERPGPTWWGAFIVLSGSLPTGE